MTAKVAGELRGLMEGDVLSSPGDLARYSGDASIYRHVPMIVALPKSADDLAAVLACAVSNGLQVTARGAGTSVGGQAIGSGIVVDCSRFFDRITAVDIGSRQAVVQPGVVLDRLRAAVAASGLTFGPDPSTSAWSTIGGAIGNNACGAHSISCGRTADNVLALTVMRSDGTTMRVGRGAQRAAADFHHASSEASLLRALSELAETYGSDIRQHCGTFARHASGYALEHLLPENGFDLARALVGSEGTCAVILDATVRLVPVPQFRAVVVFGFDDLADAADYAFELRRWRP
jgi:FAD/FMN-containing dehydrogenase